MAASFSWGMVITLLPFLANQPYLPQRQRAFILLETNGISTRPYPPISNSNITANGSSRSRRPRWSFTRAARYIPERYLASAPVSPSHQPVSRPDRHAHRIPARPWRLSTMAPLGNRPRDGTGRRVRRTRQARQRRGSRQASAPPAYTAGQNANPVAATASLNCAPHGTNRAYCAKYQT